MAKTKISEFSATPANNTDIDGINIAEGCAPSGINDAIRELMSQLKDFQAGTAGDSFNGPVGTTTAAAGAFTTLTTSSTVTHNGGTANGVAYLNGSKVLTTGSALTFDGTNLGVGTSSPSTYGKFVVNGNSALIGAGASYFYNTANDAWSYIKNSASSGSADLTFNLYGSEQMRLTSTGLGIGTSSPTVKLQVEGAANSAPVTLLRLNNSGTTAGGPGIASRISFTAGATSLGYIQGSNFASGAAGLQFSGDGTNTQATLDASGNLGLGVTPSAWGTNYKAMNLAGQGSALIAFTSAPYTFLSSNWVNDGVSDKYVVNAAAGIYRINGDTHAWFTAPSGTAGNAISFTQAMTLDASGNLGVGTTSPNNRLTVMSSSGVAGITLTPNSNFTNAGYIYNDATYIMLGSSAGSTGYKFRVALTAPDNAATIDSSGNLLVGTSSSGGEIGRLTVKQGADADNGGLRIIAPNSTNAWAPRTGSDSHFYFGYNGTSKAKIDNSTGAYSALSDSRLKENITASIKGLDCVIALEPVTYSMVGDASETQQIGFIAQAVESIVPEVVSKPSSANEYYGLNYAGFVPVLVKAIQEQQAIIQSLTARVAALEAA